MYVCPFVRISPGFICGPILTPSICIDSSRPRYKRCKRYKNCGFKRKKIKNLENCYLKYLFVQTSVCPHLCLSKLKGGKLDSEVFYDGSRECFDASKQILKPEGEQWAAGGGSEVSHCKLSFKDDFNQHDNSKMFSNFCGRRKWILRMWHQSMYFDFSLF